MFRKRKILIWKSDTGFFPSASVTPELAAVDAVNFSTLFTIATDFRLLRTTTWSGTRMNQARPVRRLRSNRWKGAGGNMKSWRAIQSKPVVEHFLCDSLEKFRVYYKYSTSVIAFFKLTYSSILNSNRRRYSSDSLNICIQWWCSNSNWDRISLKYCFVLQRLKIEY